MKRLVMACAVLAVVVALQSAAFAAPVQIDFNTAAFAGPASGTVSTFTKNDVFGTVDLTFTAYNDATLTQLGLLHWDANDGNGYADGFGVYGAPGYSHDEVDGNERLKIGFSEAVNFYGFNLTDFFTELEPSIENCTIGLANCYSETGAYQIGFGDGTSTSWLPLNALITATRGGNGEFAIDFAYTNVTSILFMAPGDTTALAGFTPGNKRLEDYSVAGIKLDVDVPQTPEPASLMLLGLGLSGLAAGARRRQKKAQASE